MDHERPPYEFRGELTGMIAGPADDHTPAGTRAIKVTIGMLFRSDGARMQIESESTIAAPDPAVIELPADLSAQLLGVLLNPRSSPETSRSTPPYAEAFDYDVDPESGTEPVARCVVCGKPLRGEQETIETEFGGAHLRCWQKWEAVDGAGS